MIAAGVALVASASATPFGTHRVGDTPLFKQCDSRWGNETMGVKGPGEQATICREGCAMTSLTMGLRDLGLFINNTELDPGVMNNWLQANEGYVCLDGDCNNLVLDAPERIPGSPLVFLGENPKPPAAELQAWADSGTEIVLLHVHNSGHFVLLRPGQSPGGPDTFNVLDPFFDVSVYPYANISDVIHYHVVRTDGAVSYPTFKQCDDRWGSNVMGSNGDTVCQVGCLMSSISAALNGHGIQVDGADANPGSLNKWLRAHDG